MSEMSSQIGMWNVIAHRVAERDIERQLRFNQMRKAAYSATYLSRLADRLPEPLQEFLKMIAGTMLAFWGIAKLLSYVAHAVPVYVYVALGLIYSLQAGYYKYRLSRNPEYRIPKCKCAGRRHDGTEAVLKSSEGSILRIPNALLGIVCYAGLLATLLMRRVDVALELGIAAICVSAYLSYVMITRIKSLCTTCVNISALNLLILMQLLR